jgi:hypothetical protein
MAVIEWCHMRDVLIGRANVAIAFLLAAAFCSAADLNTGDECVLSADGTDVFLSIDEKTNDRLTRLCTAKDEAGVAQLVLQGKVTVIQAGTRAKIIKRGFLTSEVRILQGDHAGESGIVDSESLGLARSSLSRKETTQNSTDDGRFVDFVPAHGERKKKKGQVAGAGVYVRIIQIAGKTPDEVRGVLGKPTEVTPITNYPEDMPGEYRDYKSGRLRITVQFFDGIAIGAAIDIDDPPAKSSSEALRLVGLSSLDLTKTFETPANAPIKLHAIRWRGIVDGVEIEDVSATMSERNAWTLVAIRFPRSLAISPPGKVKADTARYVAYFSNGSQKQVSAYQDDGDSFVILFATGGKGRYPKKMIERFEAIGNKATGAMRTWTDRTGKHQVEAELVAVNDGKVTLKKADGTTSTVPLEKLSEADRRFAEQSSGEKAP